MENKSTRNKSSDNIGNSNIEYSNVEEITDLVLAKLNVKYGKQFECVDVEVPAFLNKTYVFNLVESGLNYDEVGFYAYYNPEAEIQVSDGYFGVIVRDEIAEYLLYGNENYKVVVDIQSTAFDDQLTCNSSLSDAVNLHGLIRVYASIFTCDKSAYDSMRLISTFASHGLYGKVNCYVVNKDVYDSVFYSNFHFIVSDVLTSKIKDAFTESFQVEQ